MLPSLDDFTTLHLNMHGFLSHLPELTAHLKILNYPCFIGITETFIDASIKTINIQGYELVSRLDRRSGKSGGGIAFFARSDVAPAIVHVGDSEIHERSWHVLHSDQGPILIGLWYRPPHYKEGASIDSLKPELAKYGAAVINTILVGDMNVHHNSWLCFSTSTTPAGRHLHKVCNELGLIQCVRSPLVANTCLTLSCLTFMTRLRLGSSQESAIMQWF